MRVNLPSLGQQGDGLQHVLIVGGNERSEHLVRRITGKGSPDCHVEGFLDDDSGRGDVLETLGVPYLGPVTGLERLMIDRVIDCVYVCLPLRSSYDQAKSVLDLCNAAGVTVFLLADFLPLRGESSHLWRMEPQEEEGRSQRVETRGLQARRLGFMARVADALSAVFSGLAALDPAYPRQQNSGRPRPPFPM
jgi:FlaA1/EpsC-like NDP-sugar epimerase